MVQVVQEVGSDDEHMVPYVVFDMYIDGHDYPDLTADIKQMVGSNFETSPLEVSAPKGYDGEFNHEAFAKEVERIYRERVGSSGSAIHIPGDNSRTRMRNNRFTLNEAIEFDVGP